MVFTGGGGEDNVERFGTVVDLRGDDDFNEGMDSMIGRLWSFEGAATAAAAALAFLGAKATVDSIQAFAEFEEQMVEVQKVTDAQVMQEMSGELREMARTIPLTTTELSDLAGQAGRFGVHTRGGTEAMRDFVRVTAEMAHATTLGSDEAGQSFARLTKQMDLGLEKVRELGASINSLSNNLAASSNEITEAALRSSAVLSQVGLRSEDILALNGSLAAVSSSARRAGSRLRRLGQELMDPTTLQQIAEKFNVTVGQLRAIRRQAPLKLMKALSQAMKQGGDAAFALRGAFSTVSQQALAQMGQSLDQVNMALEISRGQFDNARSLARESEIAFSTLNAEWQIMKNLIHDIFIEVGKFLEPAVRDLLMTVNETIEGFARFNRHTDGLAGTMIFLGVSIAALGIALSALISLFGGLNTWIAKISAKLQNPLIRALSKSVLAFLLFVFAFEEHMPGISASLEGFIELLEDMAKAADEAIKAADKFAHTLDDMTGGTLFRILDVIGEIVAVLFVLSAAWSLVSAVASAIPFAAIASTLLNVGAAIMGIVGALSGPVLAVIALLVAAVAGLALAWERDWFNMRDIVDRMVSDFKDYLSRMGNIFNRHFDEIMSEIDETIEVWSGWVDAVVGAIDKRFPKLIPAIKAVIGGLLEVLNGFYEAVFTGFAVMFDIVLGISSTWFDAILTAFSIFFDILQLDFDEAFSKIKDFVLRTFQGITEFIDKWFGAGTSAKAIQSFQDGAEFIIGIFEWLYNKIIGDSLIPDLFKDIKSYVKETGKQLLKQGFQLAIDAAKAIFETYVTDVISGDSSIIKNLISKIKSFITGSGKTKVKNAFEDLLGSIVSIFRDWKETLMGFIGDVLDGLKNVGNNLPGGGNDGSNGSNGSNGGGDPPGDGSDGGGGQPGSGGSGGNSGWVGVSPGGGGMIGLASGGIVTRPTAAMIGEKGPEAVVPLDRANGIGKTEINIGQVNASSYKEGREAVKGIEDELKSRNFDIS